MAGALLCGLLVLSLLGFARWQARRSAFREQLETFLREAESASSAGQWREAFNAIETALSLAHARNLEPPQGWEVLQARRDEIAVYEIQHRLERLRIERRKVDDQLGEVLILYERATTDPALRSWRSHVETRARSIRDQWLVTHLDEARRQLVLGNPADALAIAEQLFRAGQLMPAELDAEVRNRTLDFVGLVVRRCGAQPPNIEVSREWEWPPELAHEVEFRPLLEQRLTDQGYLLRPPGSPFEKLWDQAPYALRLTLKEGPGVRYAQSPNRVTQIEGYLTLTFESHQVWREGIQARTRVPVRGLGAQEIVSLGFGNRANPAVERRLYADARADLLEKVRQALARLPSCPVDSGLAGP